jgi:hypothetical protein
MNHELKRKKHKAKLLKKKMELKQKIRDINYIKAKELLSFISKNQQEE